MAKQPISVKFPKELITDLDNECEGLGCNRTDFIIEAVQDKLQGKTEEQDKKAESKHEPKVTSKDQGYTVTLDDGRTYHYKDGKKIEEPPKDPIKPKVVIYLDDPPEPKRIDNANKPPVQMVQFNGKLLPFAKRYNI